MPRKHVLSSSILACALLCAPVAATAIADDAGLTRMALCQDSWLDWQKAGDPRLQKLGDHFRAAFTPHGNDPFYLPKGPTTIAGFRVLQLYPGSVGMGVGFSVLVDAPFDSVRQAVERKFGKPLTKCDTGDGMKTCEQAMAPMRTLMVMAPDKPKITSTLLGCYYYYEK